MDFLDISKIWFINRVALVLAAFSVVVLAATPRRRQPAAFITNTEHYHRLSLSHYNSRRSRRSIPQNRPSSRLHGRQRPRPSRPSRSRQPTGRPKLFTKRRQAPPLDSPDGIKDAAPALEIVYTSEAESIQGWIQQQLLTSRPCVVGMDTESVARPPWLKGRQNAPTGPVVLQLSTTESCLVVPIFAIESETARFLQNVLSDAKIIKAGVGLDDDALELYRSSNNNYNCGGGVWNTTSRLDISCVAGGTTNKRMSLQQVLANVCDIHLPKSKKLAMSDWSLFPLSSRQLAYAARDAWAAAKVLQELQSTLPSVFGCEELLESIGQQERPIEEMEDRATTRKQSKLAWKSLKDEQRVLGADFPDESRAEMEHLWKIMDESRPDPPFVFNTKELVSQQQ